MKPLALRVRKGCFGLLAFALTAGSVPGREIDLRPFWDETVPLKNPHKGWYHHFPDNHINKYRIARDADLVEFPGMDHLYIRLAWAYLEPEEGRFNWAIIDDLITKWTNHGLGIAFRISCKETSTDRAEQQFATPRWVKDAGARGGHYRMGQEVGPEGPWEPAFDDPVFLAKLENFLRAFAARYDGQPWLRYVDIGSLGDWGEGHAWAGSRKKYGFDARKKHIDLHLKYFKKSQLVLSDDFVYETGGKEEQQRLHRYALEHHITYRDDSILVDGYLAGVSSTFTVRSPEFFAEVWRQMPTVLELEHYSAVKKQGNWIPTSGSKLARYGGGKTGPDFFRGALGLLHATYIGYHGDAADWLKDNPDLTRELLNRCGYWYFLHRATLPDRLIPGQTHTFTLAWENRGAAPAYQDFQLRLRWEGPQPYEVVTDAKNRRWVPQETGKVYEESYALALSADLKPGRYQWKLKLYSPAARRDVFLALESSRLDAQNYYNLGEVEIGNE